MKTDTVLRLTRTQYRQLADQCKASGVGLNLSSFRDLGSNFGTFEPCAKLMCLDASVDQPEWDERAHVDLSTTIDTRLLRSARRPELDWTKLDDAEIYEFVVQHELGHWIDNFRIWDAWNIEDLEVRRRCESSMYMINEVLADRYAWEQIRPGETVPLGEEGKCRQEEVAESLAFLSVHVPRYRRAPRSLPGGQYSCVPQQMLFTDQFMAYIGPAVNPDLVERVRSRRVYRRDTRMRAFA